MEGEITPAFMETFSLWCNNTRYDLPGKLMAQMSKRCAALMKQGQTEGIITRRVRRETLETFIAVCKLQKFRVKPNTAFELLDLANEWDVPTLKQFVNDYVTEHNITRPDESDPLGTLARSVATKSWDIGDINGVANIINNALQDDRFLDLPPEVVFQVLLTAEQRAIDQQLLLDFTLRMFDRHPSAAVPLVLLIDFNRLSTAQADAIFTTKEVHHQNINFFISWAMSAMRNKAERELLQSSGRHKSEIAALGEMMMKAQRSAAQKARTSHEMELADLERTAREQQQELQELLEETKKESEEFANLERERKEELGELKAQIKKMTILAEKVTKEVAGQADQVKKEVSEQVGELKNELVAKLAESSAKNVEGLDRIRREMREPFEEEKKQADESERLLNAMENEKKEIEGDAVDARAVLLVKIVRDRMRFDKFLRNKGDKSKIFKAGDMWGVGPKHAKRADEVLSELQKRVDEVCPIEIEDEPDLQ